MDRKFWPTRYQVRVANGSRIVSLPGTEGTIRGYAAASLIVIDEAALWPTSCWLSVRPMLAVSNGKLVASRLQRRDSTDPVR